MKRFERSNGLDTALYKQLPLLYFTTLEFPEDTLVMLSFHFFYEEAHTCLSIVGLRVVQQVAT